jgi:phage tail sheath protein FI
MYNGAAKIVFKTEDISELVPAVATSIGAIVVDSKKGNADVPRLITNKAQFVEEYGRPLTSDLAMHAALGFLEQGQRLYVMRAHKDALYGGLEIKTDGSVEDNAAWAVGLATPKTSYSFGADGCLAIFAKNPGIWGNDVSIKITQRDLTIYSFDIDVYEEDEDGNDVLMETFEVSRKAQVDGYGNQMYVEDKINGASDYIWVVDDTTVADTVMPKAQSAALNFAGGVDGDAVTDTEVMAAWEKFTEPNEYTVNILINGGFTSQPVQAKMVSIAEARVDCTCVLDVPYADIDDVDDQVTWRTSTQQINSSFAALYSPWIKIYDEFNGQMIAIPPSGDIAAVYAYTDYVYGAAHGAPAGYNRGTLRRALQLSFGSDVNKKAYTSGERDTLDEASINPIINDPGWGIVVYGEETEQAKKSALSNVHVRRLINQIGVATAVGAKAYLFEPLLDRTYFRVRTSLEQFMAEFEGLGAFDNVDDRGWKVICDSTNNTAAVRDRNELHVWIFIKPVKVAKYIEIKAIITRSSASFEATIAAGLV